MGRSSFGRLNPIARVRRYGRRLGFDVARIMNNVGIRVLFLSLLSIFPLMSAGESTDGEPRAEVQAAPDAPERVVMARVGPAEITVEDFMGFIAVNPERVRAASGTEGKAEILRIMISNILLQQALAQEGLLPDQPTQENYQSAYRKLASKHFPLPAITDESELLAYYEANRDQYGIPASARLSHIQFRFPPDADEAARQAVKERADAALARLEKGESFADLAREVSDSPGAKESGGDLGFIERAAWSQWLISSLDSVEVGEHTGVLPSPTAYEILMVTEEREAIISPFDDVKEDIRQHLQLEAQTRLQEEYVRRLATETPVVIELDELKASFATGVFP